MSKIVRIDRDKVYTSYYAVARCNIPNFLCTAISLRIPDNFKGTILRELAPSESLLKAYKYGGISEEEYIETYKFETLSKLNAKEIYERVKGQVLLCYCGKGKFCHRHIILDWLREELGDDIIGGELDL